VRSESFGRDMKWQAQDAERQPRDAAAGVARNVAKRSGEAGSRTGAEHAGYIEAVEALANRVGAVDDADVDRVRDVLRKSLLELNLRFRRASQSDR